MDLGHFREHGYQIIPDVIGPDVIRTVGEFLSDQSANALAILRKALSIGDADDPYARIDDLARRGEFDRLDLETRQLASGHFPLSVRLSSQLWTFAREERLQAILREVFRSGSLFMHMPPTARFIAPGNRQAAVPPHQDISYNKHMSDFVTVWIPFVQIDDDCGGVAVYAGSGSQPERLTDYRRSVWLDGVATDDFEKVHCTMKPGDILLLNKWVIHASEPNRSLRVRLSIDFRFFSSPHTSSKHFLDMQTWTVVDPAARSQEVTPSVPPPFGRRAAVGPPYKQLQPSARND